ncbi:hypothetical protein B0H19DRAFT_82840 [Mycena capillaripes]|nr:hypothetical protein B0H19DRAFT_82840 [Mycena capillaripes]
MRARARLPPPAPARVQALGPACRGRATRSRALPVRAARADRLCACGGALRARACVWHRARFSRLARARSRTRRCRSRRPPHLPRRLLLSSGAYRVPSAQIRFRHIPPRRRLSPRPCRRGHTAHLRCLGAPLLFQSPTLTSPRLALRVGVDRRSHTAGLLEHRRSAGESAMADAREAEERSQVMERWSAEPAALHVNAPRHLERQRQGAVAALVYPLALTEWHQSNRAVPHTMRATHPQRGRSRFRGRLGCLRCVVSFVIIRIATSPFFLGVYILSHSLFLSSPLLTYPSFSPSLYAFFSFFHSLLLS